MFNLQLAHSGGLKRNESTLSSETTTGVLDPTNGLKPDVTFGGPRCASNVGRAQDPHGYVVNNLNGKKVAKYGTLCQEIGVEFHPAAFEVFGSTSASTEKLVERLVARAAEKSHIPFPNLLSYWRKRFSTCIQLGNVDLLFTASTRILTRSHGIRPPSAEAFLQEVLRERVHVRH